MTDSPSPAFFVGIDVCKKYLDLARTDLPGKVQRFENDPAGIAKLIATLRPTAPACIVLESTGGLERPLLDALLDASLPAALVNPGLVRHFAKGLGKLAKTDAIDAGVLAEFARLANPRLSIKRSEKQVELEALVTCRRQLMLSQTEQATRRGATRSKAALKALEAVLKTLAQQIADLEKQIRDLISSDDDFGSIDKLLQSVPGVGPVLSSTLLSELTELGSVDRGTIGSLVGVVPFNNDSGNLKGQRSIFGGRSDVRGVLYMSTIAAMRCNPIIKAFADRLKAKGKAWKVVVVACMRKLLSILNAMIRHRLSWSELQIVKNLKTA
ncbi:MAG TPA: transposase [Tepidisphaeraceae bacterium]|jgi:transposase|nr:transposase [Tepidisphaeraceae bacterium]